MLQLRLLGPVEAETRGGRIELGGGKPRALLAALALETGRVVHTERLIDIVWPEQPSASARALIQTYVSTLRRAFTDAGHPDVIVTRAPGYVLRAGAATVDADHFGRLLAEAKEQAAAQDFAPAATLLREARALWRGPALSGLEDSLLAGEARRLDELRISAAEELYAAELALGRLNHLAELTALVEECPANERLRGQLMVTLYRLGRQADALACYRTGRDTLVAELGIEPGPELSALHSAILRGEDEQLPGAAPPSTDGHRVPALLPPGLADFTGRHEALTELTEALTAGTPAVQVVAGPGGSGKSALAVHVAHGVAARFPDGQLYAELRGMTEAPATPGEVLDSFLRALGVPDPRVPESTQAKVELYRTLLAGRRVLIVLDDAAHEQQVRPLLPAGGGCAVLITSRDRLGGLAGARLTELEVLTEQEAHDLLTAIVGGDRIRAEPDAAARILTACSHLPLAIRIAGARLAMRRKLPLSVLAERLDDERHRLDELYAGDLAVRSTLSLSYTALDGDARTALGRVGHLGLPEFSTWIVALLLDRPEGEAQQLLETLVDAHLVGFTGVDAAGDSRYRLHDLVRLFARERAEETEPTEVLRAAVERALHGWLALLGAIAASSPPAEMAWTPVSAPVPEPSVEHVERLLGCVARWLTGEEPALTTTVERAAGLGLDRLVCALVSAHSAVELGSNRFEFRERITGVAVTAAQRTGDPHTQAVVQAELAQLRYAQDRFAEARRHYGEALSGFRAERDVRGQAAALAGLGTACREPGHLAEALHFLDQAGTLLHALDDRPGIGHVYRVRGSVRLEQGDYAGAEADLAVSLQAYRRAGSRRGIAMTLRTQGMLHRARGAYLEALRACAESAAVFAELGDELMRSYAVRAHAKTRMRMGHGDEALPRLEWALSAARTAGDRFGQAATLRVIGQLHLADRRLDLARSCLDAAMSLWEAMDTPLWRARTEYDLSLVHEALGDTAAARAARTHALGVFRDRGAREYAEITCASAEAADPLKHG
ncbi:AfsR/SARP family transcriptional regulator [Streptomyces sp. NPDC002845]